MKHAKEIVEPIFPAHCKTAIVLKSRKQPFDFPAAALTVQAKSSTMLFACAGSLSKEYLGPVLN
jgi:hypothetical protein